MAGKSKAASAPLPQQQVLPTWTPWLLGAVACIVYLGTLSHGFALDDVAVIGQNKYVQQGIAGIPKLLSTFYWQGFWDLNAGLYRPLSMIMFAIEWQIAANSPMVHHLVQIIIYGLSIVLLYKVLHQLFATYASWLPLAVTLLFALHPLHTEVVSNIKSRDELLCFLFFLLTLREILTKQKVTWLAAVYLLLSLLSKEAALLFIPVLWLILVFFMGRDARKAVVELMPLFIVAAIWLALHTYIIKVASPPQRQYTYEDNALVGCPNILSRVQTGLVILGIYMIKSLWPYQLSYDYSFNEVHCETGFSIKALAVLAVVAGLVYLAWKKHKTEPVLSFGILYFFIMVSMVSNVFFLIGATMGDRLLYTPLLGSMICIVWLLYKYAGQLKAPKIMNTATLIILALCAPFAWKTVTRAADWKSDYSLFRADMESAPGSARVLYNHGTALLNTLPADKEGKDAALRELIPILERSLAIDSNKSDTWVNIGSAYYKAGNYDASVAATRRAMRLRPDDTTLRINLADALLKVNKVDEAIAEYEYCVAHGKATGHVYNFLGTAYFNQGKLDKAIPVLKAGVAADSTDAELWSNYGNALGASGNYPEAIHAFNKALQVDPARKPALYALAITYQRMGDTVKAGEYLRRFQAK